MSTFKLALCQMNVKGGEPDVNRAHARELLAQAAGKGADVAILPECMDCGWTHPVARTAAGGVPDGETCTVLRQAARKHQIYVCSGLVEREGEKLYNAAVLVSPEGEILIHHRKINELEIAHDLYAQGDRLSVAHTPLCTFGLVICADSFAQDEVVTRSVGYLGAEVILSPSSWAVDADHDHEKDPYGGLWRRVYGRVCRDFGIHVIGVSDVGWVQAGPWQGRKTIGCSLVMGPGGEVLLEGPYGEEAEVVLTSDISPGQRPTRGCGWSAKWKRQKAE